MKITIDIDDKTWATLAEFADARGVKVAELVKREVFAGLRRIVGGRLPHQPRRIRTPKGSNPYAGRKVIEHPGERIRILALRDRHWTLKQIAEHLGYGSNTMIIAATLWDMGHPTYRDGTRSAAWRRERKETA